MSLIPCPWIKEGNIIKDAFTIGMEEPVRRQVQLSVFQIKLPIPSGYVNWAQEGPMNPKSDIL
jgi:hypothetical protein